MPKPGGRVWMECESSPEFVACMNRLQQEEGLLQLAS